MLFFRQLQIIRHFFWMDIVRFFLLVRHMCHSQQALVGLWCPCALFFCKKPDALERAVFVSLL